MLFRRPSYRQVALIVFALLLNALTWVQVRVAAAALGYHEMCLQAHGGTKSAELGGRGSVADRDTCVAHCAALPTDIAGALEQGLAPALRGEAIAATGFGDPPVTARRSPQQARAPPAA